MPRPERPRPVRLVRRRRRGCAEDPALRRHAGLVHRAYPVPARMLQRPRLSRQGRQLALSLRRLDPLRTDRGQGRKVRRGSRLRLEPCRFPTRHRGHSACDDVTGFLDHDRRQPADHDPLRTRRGHGVVGAADAADAQQARRQSAARRRRHQRTEDQGGGLAISAATRPRGYRPARRDHDRRHHARGNATGPDG
ncbi:hypothetical protein ACVWYH_004218 [Bradyrhizobium sp. GM24.11]